MYAQFLKDQRDRANSDHTNKELYTCLTLVRTTYGTDLPNLYCSDLTAKLLTQFEILRTKQCYQLFDRLF